MKYAIVFATLAASVRAELLDLDLGVKLPLGIELHIGPHGPPPEDCINVWHPPHHGVDIDNCDNDEEDDWHYVHPGHGNYPDQGQYIWTTQTVTSTASQTVYGCPTDVPDCPEHHSYVTTIEVPETTTICPVPAPEGYEAPTSAYYVPTITQVYEQPSGEASYPPEEVTTKPYEFTNTHAHYTPSHGYEKPAETTSCPEEEYTQPNTVWYTKPGATWETQYKPPTATESYGYGYPGKPQYTPEGSAGWYPPAGTPGAPPVWTNPGVPPAETPCPPPANSPPANLCPGPNCPPGPPPSTVIPVVPVESNYSPVPPAESPSQVVVSGAVRNAGGLLALFAFVALL